MTEPTATLTAALDALDALTVLGSLEPGWLDGSGATITPTSIAATRDLLTQADTRGLPQPAVFPMEDGGVLAEWWLAAHTTSLSIEFTPDGAQASGAAVRSPNGPHVTYDDVPTADGITRTLDHLATLTGANSTTICPPVMPAVHTGRNSK